MGAFVSCHPLRHRVLIPLVLLCAGAAAGETIDYSRAAHWTAVLSLPGEINGFSALNHRGYACCADGNLYTVDTQKVSLVR
jgi:hypothetical protein